MPDERNLQRLLDTDQRRLRTIQEGLSRSDREQAWHREHTDRIKRRIDDTAKKLGL